MQYSQFILLENNMIYHRNSTTNCNVVLQNTCSQLPITVKKWFMVGRTLSRRVMDAHMRLGKHDKSVRVAQGNSWVHQSSTQDGFVFIFKIFLFFPQNVFSCLKIPCTVVKLSKYDNQSEMVFYKIYVI